MRTATRTTLHPRRRGITLVEMLVSVALLILMMIILVEIFQKTTGSITEQRTYAALDQELRRIDTIIRQDLQGVTARMTPPNDPIQSRGYFEYAENALADLQGEDSDDTLRFTAQAPAGKPFLGRVWIPRSLVPDVPPIVDGDPGYANVRSITLEPVTVQSQHAEIIYFLRNGNLYRRVLLIKPDFIGKVGVGNFPSDPPITTLPNDPRLGNPQSFQFMTNLFQPASVFPPLYFNRNGIPVASWLGMNDISARPSNFAAILPPSLLDYRPITNNLSDLTDRHNRAFNPRFSNNYTGGGPTPADLLPDTFNAPDDANQDAIPDYYPTLYPNSFAAGLVNEWVDLGAGPVQLNAANMIANRPALAAAPTPYDILPFPFVFPNSFSRADFPIAASNIGALHSLDPAIVPVPNAGRPNFGTFLDPPYNHNPLDLGDSLPPPGAGQTWWGFPTWRETASPNWLDPLKRINDPLAAPYYLAGVRPPLLTNANDPPYAQPQGLRAGGIALPFQPSQLFSDGAGDTSVPPIFSMPPEAVWEDDLLMSGVRSFDVKAYDPNPAMIIGGVPTPLTAGYYDLGYANLLNGTPPLFLGSFAHEGRMPPLTTDFRFDPQFPARNLGDDSTGVIRMRRVWDSWSTTYTNAPGLPLDPTTGPLNGLPPVLPSYPPPYPAPLRSIQIQIRVTDPNGKRAKTMTIRQDFVDKL